LIVADAEPQLDVVILHQRGAGGNAVAQSGIDLLDEAPRQRPDVSDTGRILADDPGRRSDPRKLRTPAGSTAMPTSFWDSGRISTTSEGAAASAGLSDSEAAAFEGSDE
jgi:hypothetical protein